MKIIQKEEQTVLQSQLITKKIEEVLGSQRLKADALSIPKWCNIL